MVAFPLLARCRPRPRTAASTHVILPLLWRRQEPRRSAKRPSIPSVRCPSATRSRPNSPARTGTGGALQRRITTRYPPIWPERSLTAPRLQVNQRMPKYLRTLGNCDRKLNKSFPPRRLTWIPRRLFKSVDEHRRRQKLCEPCPGGSGAELHPADRAPRGVCLPPGG